MDSVTFVTVHLSMVFFILLLPFAIKKAAHYFLRCPNFSNAHNNFLNDIAIIGRLVIDQDEIKIIETFFTEIHIFSSLNVKYILETKRFDGSFSYKSLSMHNDKNKTTLAFFYYSPHNLLLLLQPLFFSHLVFLVNNIFSH